MPTEKVKVGDTVVATVNKEKTKAVVHQVEESKLRICAMLEPSYRGTLFTSIDLSDVIEIDKSVPRMNQEEIDTNIHKVQDQKKK